MRFFPLILLACALISCAERPAATPPATAPAVSQADDSTTLSAEEFDKQIKQHPEYVVLDVRTPAEYQTGHLAGAVNMDVTADDFDANAQKLDPSKTYLVYCRSGRRSATACDKLADRKIKTLNLAGGIAAWQAANLPTTQP